MKAVYFHESLRPLLVPLDSVRQHPDNANNGDVEELINLIKLHGFSTAITVNRNTGYIEAGNHRWQALHALGATQVPVIYVDRDPEDSKRYLIADNRASALARMDEAALAELLQDLQATEKGLVGTAYTDDQLERLLMDLAQAQLEEPGHGFGGGEPAPTGIYQVVVEFDNDDERDEMFAMLTGQYPEWQGKIRTVNL